MLKLTGGRVQAEYIAFKSPPADLSLHRAGLTGTRRRWQMMTPAEIRYRDLGGFFFAVTPGRYPRSALYFDRAVRRGVEPLVVFLTST
jgi:hypothetical protein